MGYYKNNISHETRKLIAEAACRQVEYGGGYSKTLAASQVRKWLKEDNEAIEYGLEEVTDS